MFRHLLVPLDDSGLAECVLPPARDLAARLGAAVTLLHVLERDAPAQVHGDRHLAAAGEARAYLDGVASRLHQEGVRAGVHVHETAEGRVARSIADHARELGCDLIVLATHGRGGVRGFFLGSIAQQVTGDGAAPVFLVHPDAVPDPLCCRRLAVPLDGAPDHERCLPVAIGLARAFGASLHLVTVVPRRSDLTAEEAAAGRLLPASTRLRLEVRQQESARYLAELRRRLEPEGVPVTAEVRRGEPVAQILAALRATGADVVVFGTHATKGWEAFWAGSVTPRVLPQWRRPALLVPV